MPIMKMKLFQFIVGFVLISMICSCGLSTPCNETEVERTKSPDGKVDAVMVKKNCGATTSESTNIFIVGSGNNTEEKDLVFRADHIDGFSLAWRESKFLEIQYKQARIFQYMNFWQSKDVDNFAYVVEIRETALSSSHALSPSDRWEK